MITLALGQCVFFAAFQASSWTGGDNGLRDVIVPPFGVGGLTVNMVDPLVRYYVILLFVALALYFLFRVLSSPFGLTLEMIRENETRARSCGYRRCRHQAARVRDLRSRQRAGWRPICHSPFHGTAGNALP